MRYLYLKPQEHGDVFSHITVSDTFVRVAYEIRRTKHNPLKDKVYKDWWRIIQHLPVSEKRLKIKKNSIKRDGKGYLFPKPMFENLFGDTVTCDHDQVIPVKLSMEMNKSHHFISVILECKLSCFLNLVLSPEFTEDPDKETIKEDLLFFNPTWIAVPE